ncbi:hypothetical protein DH2020_002713 [Rehmannia glutinosa]|uniref:DC1 domain-containing protein n=1 Tax=Rehmannia glutinosa TaxID=99300 RepID=A0ABR0XUK7_REHGL
MKHCSHPHDLFVASHMVSNNQNLACFGCKLPLFGTCYACSGCNFYLHKFCFELPQSAQFDSHPNHTLGLLYPPYCQSGPCDACGESCNGFTYNCTFCNYNIHANCATLLHSQPQNERDQYVAEFFRHKMSEVKSMRSQLAGSMSGKKQQINDQRDELEYVKKMEMEAELQRRRHNLFMQQMKRASDSIDFMGQIGTSNYTYRYY